MDFPSTVFSGLEPTIMMGRLASCSTYKELYEKNVTTKHSVIPLRRDFHCHYANRLFYTIVRADFNAIIKLLNANPLKKANTVLYVVF